MGLQAPLLLTNAMAPALAHGNPLSLLAGDNKAPTGTGWSAFGDVDMLVGFAGALLLASALGWVLAWSPRQTRYLERMSGAATSTVMVLYAVVGATIGALVTQYGMGVGLVVFGIGGLTRFRSNVGTPESTGRLISATLVGLCAGLELPHVAVSATFFMWLVLWLATRRATFACWSRARS